MQVKQVLKYSPLTYRPRLIFVGLQPAILVYLVSQLQPVSLSVSTIHPRLGSPNLPVQRWLH